MEVNSGIDHFFTALRKLQINLEIDNAGGLAIRAPKGVLTNDILQQIKERKSELISYLPQMASYSLLWDQIPEAPVMASYPLSSSQRRLWIQEEVNRQNTAYNIFSCVTLRGILHPALFEQAIRDIVERHEILRTVFREDEQGEVRQWILMPADLPFVLPYIELQHDGNASEKIEQLMWEDKGRPFNLRKGPLFRAILFRRSEDEYLLYYCMHHIISDAWSLNVLREEVSVRYHNLVNGNSQPLLPLRIQYKDYASWQLAQLTTPAFQVHRAYWQQQFAGELPVLQLPADKRRPALLTDNGFGLSAVIDPELTNKLKVFCSRHNATLFMGLLAALNTLLYRYSGQDDIIIGSPVAGRGHTELEDQLGFYVNTLALRTRFNGNDNFLQLLANVHSTTLAAYEHQTYPFDQLVEEMEWPRDRSRSVLFDVFINLENLKEHTVQSSIAATSNMVITETGPCASKFDLLINIREEGGTLLFYVQFNRDIYTTESITRLLKHYQQVMAAVIQYPETPLNKIDYLSLSERKQLLEDYTATNVSYQPMQSVMELLARSIQRKGDSIAVRCGEHGLTYKELNSFSDRLACILRTRYRVIKGERVAIQLERSEWVVPVIIAILKTGAVYVPVDPAYPKARVEYILEDSQCRVLINDTLLESLQQMAQTDEWNDSWTGTIVTANDLAYIIYTSGSTGKPKGVMVTHGNLYHYMSYCLNTYFSGDVHYIIPFFTSLSFDLTVTSIFGALIGGGELVVYDHAHDMQEILEDIFFGTKKVNFLKCTPAHITLMEGWRNKETKVSKIIVGGEELKQQHVSLLQSLNGSITIYNEYGPTEATVGCIVEILQQPFAIENDHSIAIGTPIANTQAYILDAYGGLVPTGVPGELYIGGDGVTKGYVNRPDLTAEKFIDHPWLPGSKLYRTGDRARWLSSGRIEYLGRLDAQVKIRGYRIEPAEIECAIAGLPGIHAAVVTVAPGTNEQPELIAYIVCEQEQSVASLRARLEEQLPGYMIPLHFIRLDRIPLTVNGKVDKKALPLPGVIEWKEDAGTAPRNEVEKALVTCCEQIMKQPVTGIRDNFFRLGGDSIKAILLASKMKQQGYAVKVGDILKYPVLEELAERIQSANQHILQASVEGTVALTPVQRWFLELEYADKHHYNQSLLLYSKSVLNKAVLEKCLQAIVSHHDALRMVFRHQQGGWQQYNRSNDNAGLFCLEEYELLQRDDAVQEMGIICERLQAGFDLEQGPLVKAGLLHLPDGDRLLLVIHHLVVDAVSWRILLEDLAVLYQQCSHNQEISLPPKTHSFREWARQLQLYADSAAAARELEYWKNVVHQTMASGFPAIRNDTAKMCGEWATVIATARESFTEETLTRINRVYNTGMNEILLAALAHAMYTTFGSTALLVELEGHGREEVLEHINITRTVGWFTSLYPVVLQTGYEEVLNCLVDVKEYLRKVPGKGIGYGMLRYLRKDTASELQPARPADIVFNYLGSFESGVQNSSGAQLFGLSAEYRGREFSSRYLNGHSLVVTGFMNEGRLRIRFNFDKNKYLRSDIDLLANNYAGSLATLIQKLQKIKDPVITPSDLSYKGLTITELNILNAGGTIEDVYGVSPLQEGIYYHWLSEPHSLAYVEQMCYNVSGHLDIDVLERSFAYLIGRHAVLRTSFHHEYGNCTLQAVHKGRLPDFKYNLLSPDEPIEDQLTRYRETDRNKSFDLAAATPVRLTVLGCSRERRYEFIWSHHHIIMDGWCISLLVNEFYTIYQALLNQREPSLKQMVPYVHYIQWLAKTDVQAHAGYWQRYLHGYQALSVIPFVEGLGKPTNSVENVVLTISSGRVAQIRQLGTSIGITENTFMQTAWGYLLSRYNNNHDVIFGTVVSGRPGEIKGVEDMIGLFINTIPVRVQYEENSTVKDLFLRMQQSAIESLPHHYGRLSDIQAQSDMRNGLFDHILVFENYPVQERVSQAAEGVKGLDELRMSSSGAIEQTNYVLTILVASHQNTISVIFKFDPAALSKPAVERMAGHLRTVIDAFTEDPYRSLSSVNYLTATEYNQVLKYFNDTGRAVEKGITLPALFNRQVMVYPNAPALCFKGQWYTYRELDTLSDQLAGFLQEYGGIQHQEQVGILLKRSEWLIIAMLAVLKTGAAYVPIDPDYPEERIRYVLSDSGCRICIDDAMLQRFIPVRDVYQSARFSGGKETDLAYVIYTSGSSGKPKGCMVEHQALINHMTWKWEHFGFTQSDIVLQKTTCTFDVSVWEIFLPLCWGCRLVLCEDEDIYSPNRIVSLVADHQITVIHFVPGLLKIFIETVKDDPGIVKKLSSLRLVMTSGEALPVQTVRHWYQLFNIPVHNLYGPTEAAIEVSAFAVAPGVGKMSIGKPVGNTSLYVLHSAGLPAGIGIAGELYIGGAQLARGYWNRPDLTREKFVLHASLPGMRLYRSGDKARWLADGNIEFMGRLDDQVKVRGYRIEPGEIEQGLLSVAGIRAAAVVTKAVKDKEQTELVAYIVSNEKVDTTTLRRLLQQHLPGYMVPAHFIQVAQLPVTSSGKINKKALSDHWQAADDNAAAYVPPRNAMEEVLVAIYRRLFEKDCIGVNDNFFELGGNSIKAISLAGQLQQRGYIFKISDVLKYPVIAELANKLNENSLIAKEAAAADSPATPTQLSESGGVSRNQPIAGWFDLSYNQQFYIKDEQFIHSTGTILFHLPDFSQERFMEAYRRLITDVTWLRTAFSAAGKRIVQRILPVGSQHLQVTFLQEQPSAVAVSQVAQMMQSMVQKPFDLWHGETVRCAVLQEATGATVFMVLHHIITDLPSNKLLQERLWAYYYDMPVKQPSFSYFDFIPLQQQYLQSHDGKQKMNYWQQQLQHTGVLHRPLTGAVSTHEYTCTIMGDLYKELQAFYLQERILPGVFVLTACCIAMTMSCPQAGRFLVNVVVNGRDIRIPGFSAADVIGQFSNTLPLTGATSGRTVRELLQYVQELYLQLRMHQEIPYRLICRQCMEKHALNVSTLLHASFNYQEIVHESVPVTQEQTATPGNTSTYSINPYETLSVTCLHYKDGMVLKCHVQGLVASEQLPIETIIRQTLQSPEMVLP